MLGDALAQVCLKGGLAPSRRSRAAQNLERLLVTRTYPFPAES